MSFTASFTTTQGQDCTQLTITDTSSYSSESKSSFSARRLYLYKADGTTFKFPSTSTTDYIDFSFGAYTSDSITITNIDKDYAFSIQLVLTPVSQVSGSVYSSTQLVLLTCYISSFLYSVTEIAAANPSRVNQDGFYDSWSALQTEEDAATKAAIYGDIASADAALGRAQSIISQSNLRF